MACGQREITGAERTQIRSFYQSQFNMIVSYNARTASEESCYLSRGQAIMSWAKSVYTDAVPGQLLARK